MTKAQRRLLYEVARASDNPEWAGLCARGIKHATILALTKPGFIRYVDHGGCEEGDPDREWPIYAITDAGRAFLAPPRPPESTR